jgi:acetylornithine deacetylase/succinyl-diaminopimelate desuccinylase-like protein
VQPSTLELLQELLRVDSTNPPGNEAPAAELLESYLQGAGLKTRLFTSPDGRPSLVARLEGPRDLPPLVLLSHTDVVGVEEQSWSHDPFGGEVDQGYVWGRGALDMKAIAVMHAAAAASLAASAATRRREVIVVAVADEEAGGGQGAQWLVDQHPEEVGLGGPPSDVLGEGGYGLSSVLDRPVMPIVLGEKSTLWLMLHAHGDPGHGSLPPARQAIRNLVSVLRQVTGRRNPRVHPVMREQFAALARHSRGARRALFKALASPVGGVTTKALDRQLQRAGAIGQLVVDTVTVTQVEAGHRHNVVPGEATAALDCRLLPDVNVDAFVEGMQRRASRHDVTVEVVARYGSPISQRTPLFDILADVSSGLATQGGSPVIVPSLTPPMTDIRFFRAKGASGYGWAPVVLTPELLATIHGHDERIGVEDFERGVEATAKVVRRAAT